MPTATISVQNNTESAGCAKLVVTDQATGKEIFHAEIWNFGNGKGDIDIFTSSDKTMTVLEWQNGSETLRHICKPGHIAIDVK